MWRRAYLAQATAYCYRGGGGDGGLAPLPDSLSHPPTHSLTPPPQVQVITATKPRPDLAPSPPVRKQGTIPKQDGSQGLSTFEKAMTCAARTVPCLRTYRARPAPRGPLGHRDAWWGGVEGGGAAMNTESVCRSVGTSRCMH